MSQKKHKRTQRQKTIENGVGISLPKARVRVGCVLTALETAEYSLAGLKEYRNCHENLIECKSFEFNTECPAKVCMQ